MKRISLVLCILVVCALKTYGANCAPLEHNLTHTTYSPSCNGQRVNTGFTMYNNYAVLWFDNVVSIFQSRGQGECGGQYFMTCYPIYYSIYYGSNYIEQDVTNRNQYSFLECGSTTTVTRRQSRICNYGGCGGDLGPPPEECWDCSCSPIVIDVLGNGINLTNAAGGVNFDINADGGAERRGWTAIGADDAWLALDRNNNETIDDGTELFGNATPQPPSAQKNGFLALAEYDNQGAGGNNDGRITVQDSIFPSLRLWRDTNHNGFSESNELHSLPSVGLAKIDLDYRESRFVDQHGNQFRYRSKVRDTQDAQIGRWAWDVWLVRG